MAEQKLTIRQKQRIGAKIARFSREVDTRLNKRNEKFRGLMLEMIERCYKEGFHDGINTEREEQNRIKTTKRGAYC